MLKKISKTALAVTFTAGQAKRDAPGPFAEAAGLK